jgi:hypothetical protein
MKQPTERIKRKIDRERMRKLRGNMTQPDYAGEDTAFTTDEFTARSKVRDTHTGVAGDRQYHGRIEVSKEDEIEGGEPAPTSERQKTAEDKRWLESKSRNLPHFKKAESEYD